MRLASQRDLRADARPLLDGTGRVLIRIGPFKFTSCRSEVIALAAELVHAVDQLDSGNNTENNTEGKKEND